MNLTLRPITKEDEPFLLSLYALSRAAELSLVPWTQEQKDAFVKMQFDSQHSHYQTHFPDASYNVILFDEKSAGRLYVLRDAEQIRVLDINLTSDYRNKGIGKHFIEILKTEAEETKKALRIFLEINNPYMALFESWGFKNVRTDDGFYCLMEWLPDKTEN